MPTTGAGEGTSMLSVLALLASMGLARGACLTPGSSARRSSGTSRLTSLAPSPLVAEGLGVRGEHLVPARRGATTWTRFSTGRTGYLSKMTNDRTMNICRSSFVKSVRLEYRR